MPANQDAASPIRMPACTLVDSMPDHDFTPDSPLRLIQTTPVLHVGDIVQSLAYFTGVLGWACNFTWGNPVDYAGVRLRDTVLHLAQTEPTSDRRGKATVYLFVGSGLDEYFALIAAAGAIILSPPTPQPYGMREFTIADPDGNRIHFGMET